MQSLKAFPWGNAAKALAFLALILFATSTCADLRRFETEVSELAGIRIGESRDEVRYRLGIPERVLAELAPIEVDGKSWGAARIVYWVENPPSPVNALPAGTEIDDYSAWDYVQTDNARLTVEFGPNGAVKDLECTALRETRPYACGPVAGIWNGESEEKVLLMGEPTREQISGVTKLMVYEDLGVYFRLTEGRVYQVGLSGGGRKSQASIGRYLNRRFR
jgi:hypothetical protein